MCKKHDGSPAHEAKYLSAINVTNSELEKQYWNLK